MTTPAKPLTADEIADLKAKAEAAIRPHEGMTAEDFAFIKAASPLTILRLVATIEQQAEQIEKLRKALQFYAHHDNWINDVVDIGVGNEEIPQSNRIYHEGCGTTAEQTLAETEPPK